MALVGLVGHRVQAEEHQRDQHQGKNGREHWVPPRQPEQEPHHLL